MKEKLIRLVLQKKFNNWVESIEDVDVRQSAKMFSFISGGAITSLLLGEKINDYDIYMTNKETVVAVLNYYLEKFKLRQRAAGKELPEGTKVEETNGRVGIMVPSRGVIGEEESEVDYQFFETIEGDLESLQFIEDVVKLNKENVKVKEPFVPIFMTATQ